MVTHEHDLVRHFGGRIININAGEIVFDEVITGINTEALPEAELARAMDEAAAVSPRAGDMQVDEVIAALSGCQNSGGAK